MEILVHTLTTTPEGIRPSMNLKSNVIILEEMAQNLIRSRLSYQVKKCKR